jgi:hypothetical protein
MLPQDFQELLRQKPFHPLKLRLCNGKEYEVRHPEIAAVRLSVVWLYLPLDWAKPIGNNIVVVTLQQIVEIEMLPLDSAGKGNGAISG